jgi:PhoPQ-activated pathogenicity-related protein
MKNLILRCLLVLSLVGLLPSVSASGKVTALDRYIARPDTNYSCKVVSTIPGEGQTTFVLELISQAYLTTNEVNQPVWRHWLTITKPDKLESSKALLFITGGSLDKPAPKGMDANLLRIATATKSVVAEIRGVPNQPLYFKDETIPRSEDAFIAYTWDKFMRTRDEKWPARLPMTKSAVRALDAVTEFCASEEGGKTKIDGFVVSGASKRGWTTWTTAIVDKRVVAIIPIVIDLLNIRPSFTHHYEAYGFWAPAVKDYTNMKLMDWIGHSEHRALLEIEDPYEYRERLTMPKFLINACGDQFFVLDSSQFYFNDLPGTKYLRYVPNADHSLRGSDAFETVMTCYSAVLTGAKLPEFSWTLEKDGSIRVTTKDKPGAVKLWQASNPNTRDFRLETIGATWTSTPLKGDEKAVYVGKIETPEKGWSAFMVELTYPNKNAPPFKFTTNVRVLPETMPFKLESKPKPN